MRTATIVLAVLGGLAAGFLGMTWLKDANSDKIAQAREAIETAKKMGADMSAAEAELAALDKVKIGAYLLVAGLACGLAGAWLTMQGNQKIAGPVMVAGALLPAVFAPKALVFTCLLLLAGVLAFLGKGEPAPAAAGAEPRPQAA